MIYIEIPEIEEPECLSNLKHTAGAMYFDLTGICKDEVEKKLISLQNGLCAYCQKSIIRVKTIEHYFPVSKEPSRQLDWNNFIAVCSGCWYLNTHNNDKILYCSKSRGNHDLKFNPKNREHIESLYYEDYCIKSVDPILNKDLSSELNLNFDEIKSARKQALIDFEKKSKLNAIKSGISKDQYLPKALDIIKSTNPEYSGYLIFIYSKKLGL